MGTLAEYKGPRPSTRGLRDIAPERFDQNGRPIPWWKREEGYPSTKIDYLNRAMELEAESQQFSRPFSANSQCGKLLAALERGETLTTLKAINITGGTDGARRLREVRRYLASHGKRVSSRWVKTEGGARVMEFYLTSKNESKNDA